MNPRQSLPAVIAATALLGVLCTWQLRLDEAAVLSTFGKPEVVKETGLHLRLPWPMQKLDRIDLRRQVVESTPQNIATTDGTLLINQCSAGWRVENPLLFRTSLGSVVEATAQLRGLLEDCQNSVLRHCDIKELVGSTSTLAAIEEKIRSEFNRRALENYGVTCHRLCLTKLAVGQKNAESILARMKQEMRGEADAVKAEADAAARKQRDEADARRTALITAAETKARTELGALQAEIASSYKSYNNDPGSIDFAIFLRKSAALGEGFKSQTTWFLDPRTQPVDLLRVPDAAPLSPAAGARP